MQLLKSKVLQKAREAEYGSHDDVGDDELEGLDVQDVPSEESAAERWLRENEPASNKKNTSRQWSPRADYSPAQKSKIDELVGQGYHPREAEYHAGAMNRPRDYESAKRSGLKPDVSTKLLSELEEPHTQRVNEEKDQDTLEAGATGETSKPVRFADLAVTRAHQAAVGDYDKAHKDFLNSDEVKDLKGRARLQAVQSWKDKWKQDNPEHESKILDVSAKAQEAHATAQNAIKTRAAEDMERLKTAGGIGESSMSNAEMAQHLGSADEETGAAKGGGIVNDPMVAFRAKKSQVLQHLDNEQKRRMQNVDAAAATKGVIRVRKNPKSEAV